MNRDKVKSELEIKPVELRHVKQFNELLRYVFQVTDDDIEESGYEDELEIIRSKRPVLREAEVFGWFHKDQLISQIAIYPCQVNIHNRIYKMAGITGVGTYPEYAGLGLMNELIKISLEKMRENEQYISYLFPYSIPYYRKRGWEVISDKMTFNIKDTQLPKMQHQQGSIKRHEIDHPDVLKVYDIFANNNHGALIRGSLNWEEYWRWENEEERTAAIYYNDDDKPTGFCFYWIADDVFNIKEMVYLDQEACRGLWSFIAAHFSMVNRVKGYTYKNEPISFIFEDSEIAETIEPYFMGRIVDVKPFLEHYAFEEPASAFYFVVQDSLAEWNNGVFGIKWVDGHPRITDEAEGERIELNIQTLTALLMSYKRPSYLRKLGRIDCSSKGLRILETIIPDSVAYFSDYF